jgi:hypothetical protein
LNTVITKNHGFWIGIKETVIFNSSLIILNCTEYNKCCILEKYFYSNCCQAATRIFTIFIICIIRSCFMLVIFNNMTFSVTN